MALVENSAMVNRQTKFCHGGLSSSGSRGSYSLNFYVCSCNSMELVFHLAGESFVSYLFVRISLCTDCWRRNLPYLSRVYRLTVASSLFLFVVSDLWYSNSPVCLATSAQVCVTTLYLYAFFDSVVTPLELVVS